MTKEDKVREVYDSWYAGNRKRILNGEWNLIDRDFLLKPERDKLRGLNLISYVPADIRKRINSEILPKINQIIGDSGWMVPDEGRHFTILDIIPHNSGVSETKIKTEAEGFIQAIDSVVARFNKRPRVRFEGVFASPDGITLQGFPDDAIGQLREVLRNELADRQLMNLESKKYFIETAHVALIKFIKPISGSALLQVVDGLREVNAGEFEVIEIVLNISPRYDKTKTIEIIKKFQLGSINAGGWT